MVTDEASVLRQRQQLDRALEALFNDKASVREALRHCTQRLYALQHRLKDWDKLNDQQIAAAVDYAEVPCCGSEGQSAGVCAPFFASSTSCARRRRGTWFAVISVKLRSLPDTGGQDGTGSRSFFWAGPMC